MNTRLLVIALLLPIALALLVQRDPELLDALSSVLQRPLRRLT